MRYTAKQKEELAACETTEQFESFKTRHRLSTGVASLKRRAREYRGLPKETVHDFLSRGRTEDEIKKEFGSKVSLAPPEGFDLFEGRNAFNDRVFVHLPRPDRPWQPKNPAFSRHVAEKTPWVRVQFPDSSRRRLDIVPIYDVHYGHREYRREKFLEYLEYIRRTPSVFTFLGGDIIENASRESVGAGVYEQSVMPNEQIHEIVNLLRPLAHKIMFSIRGNHEYRSMKVLGIDIGQVIAEALSVPYFAQPVYADLSWKGYSWRIHAQHGSSAAQTHGGQINAATKVVPVQGDFTHAFFSGHTHSSKSIAGNAVCRNWETGELEERKYFVIIMPSFLGYFGTYGAERGWAPPSSGSVRLSLYPNGDYHHGI